MWPLITSVQCIYFKCHIAIIFLDYSNFDKHHYKDSHRAQCTEPTHLALFSSNSSTFSVVIENAVGYNFYANNSLDRPMDGRLLGSAKCYIFKIRHPKFMLVQPFNIRLKPVCIFWKVLDTIITIRKLCTFL